MLILKRIGVVSITKQVFVWDLSLSMGSMYIICILVKFQNIFIHNLVSSIILGNFLEIIMLIS